MDIKKIFGSTLTILGIIVVLYACIAFLSDGRRILGFSVDKVESIVPFLVGLVFLMSGISLIKRS
jgi:Ca2+/Na+ antiporter